MFRQRCLLQRDYHGWSSPPGKPSCWSARGPPDTTCNHSEMSGDHPQKIWPLNLLQTPTRHKGWGGHNYSLWGNSSTSTEVHFFSNLRHCDLVLSDFFFFFTFRFLQCGKNCQNKIRTFFFFKLIACYCTCSHYTRHVLQVMALSAEPFSHVWVPCLSIFHLYL